mmetsp:Transcript_1188/g.1809  ORF Transcript_1188/g.1809 Transcript_1188/m.1809 type:complete len:92 (+) Transcript_1188:116-391(+)
MFTSKTLLKEFGSHLRKRCQFQPIADAMLGLYDWASNVYQAIMAPWVSWPHDGSRKLQNKIYVVISILCAPRCPQNSRRRHEWHKAQNIGA